MIRYRKKIQAKTNRNGDLSLETDLGQTWRTIQINGQTPMSDWLYQSAQQELQQWQKDMAKVVFDAFMNHVEDHCPYVVYNVYQKGQGYASRNSDVFLMRIPSKNVWFISTSGHTWVFEEALDNFPIPVDEALGSILDRQVRQELYDWSDNQRGIKTKKIMYSDEQYLEKGLAQ
jgi:hypothetical protein